MKLELDRGSIGVQPQEVILTSPNSNLELRELAHKFQDKQEYIFDGSRKELRKLCRKAKQIVHPQITMGQHHNAKYSSSEILDVLTHAALTDDFATNGSKTYGILNEDSPHFNSVLYRVRKLEVRKILNQFNSAVSNIIRKAKKKGMLRGRIDLAVDITEWMYYGDENDSMIVKTKHKDGTDKAYRFATINILVDGERFTLKAIPMSPFSRKEEILSELLDCAEEIVDIGNIYLDRGFFTVDCIRVLKEAGVKFLMPATKSERVKEEAGKSAPRIIDFEYGVNRSDPVIFDLVIVEDENGVNRTFATNLPVSEDGAERLFDLYSKRWGIETSYRVKKNFRPKTTSKNYEVRLFYFLLSVCLYNLWILLNFLVGTRIGKNFEKLQVTSKLFCAMMSLPPPEG